WGCCPRDRADDVAVAGGVIALGLGAGDRSGRTGGPGVEDVPDGPDGAAGNPYRGRLLTWRQAALLLLALQPDLADQAFVAGRILHRGAGCGLGPRPVAAAALL